MPKLQPVLSPGFLPFLLLYLCGSLISGLPSMGQYPAGLLLNQPSLPGKTTGSNDVVLIRSFFTASESYDWKKTGEEHDQNGVFHIRYQQYTSNAEVENAVVIVHVQPSGTKTITGNFVVIADNILAHQPPESEFLQQLVVPHGENSESDLSTISKGSIVWRKSSVDGNYTIQFRYVMNPGMQGTETVYFDLQSGTITERVHPNCFANTPGTAETIYYGLQGLSTSFTPNAYVLREYSRGGGVETFNLNYRTDYQSISEFEDADNFWEAHPSGDSRYAADAHFCAIGYYDFLREKFNRNSIDNNGQKLISYLNYGINLNNAFWNGSSVVYGSGSGNTNPLTTLDIAGHEFTHGLIQKTCALGYQGEQGTIQEALSDIFGTALEFFVRPQQANWTIAESTGTTLRSMNNPGLYGQPSCYYGTNWYSGPGDNGGVHVNSGFINSWFYLLSVGGQGVNETGAGFSVTGIGMENALDIVYHTLIAYITPSTNFHEFSRYTLQSTCDLFGACSPQYSAVLNAWKAVNLPVESGTTPLLTSLSTPAICEGDSLLLQAEILPGSQITWYRNDTLIPGLGESRIFINQAGNYRMTEQRCGQILFSNSLNVYMFQRPEVTVNNFSVCEGELVFLTGMPLGGTFNVPNPYSGPGTSFQYQYTDEHGCSGRASGSVYVHPNPQPHITNTPLHFPVNGNAVTLTASLPGVFSGPGITDGVLYPELAGQGGPYSMRFVATTNFGCTGNDSADFIIDGPCRRDTTGIILTMELSNGSEKEVHCILDVEAPDFFITWHLPVGCELKREISENHILVSWNGTSSILEAELTNTCGESYRVSGVLTPTDKKNSQEIEIHPNPACSTTLVSFREIPEMLKSELIMVDASGKTVRKFPLAPFSLQQMINLTGLEEGTYQLLFRSGGQTICRPLVIAGR